MLGLLCDAADVVDVSGLLGDLADEGDELDRLVAGLDDTGWATPTPAEGWTVAHQVAHLCWTDEVALLAVADDGSFDRVLEDAMADIDNFVDRGAEEIAALDPPALLDRWRAGRTALVAALVDPIHTQDPLWRTYMNRHQQNLPHQYHNGGIWPFIGGLWVRFLAKLSKQELAHRELNALAEACRTGIYGEWEFNEWMHGITGRPMGKAHQAWTAASYIAAYQALNNDLVPVDFAPLKPALFDPTKDKSSQFP